MRGGGPAPQTLSAVGLFITLDWLLTQEVLKKCTWLATFPSSCLWGNQVLCSGISLHAKAGCRDQCALALWGGALAVDFGNLQVWAGDSDSGVGATLEWTQTEHCRVNFPALYRTMCFFFSHQIVLKS